MKMPRTLLQDKPNAEIRYLLMGRMYGESGNLSAAAVKTGISESTLRRKLKNPETFTIRELISIARRYHIPIEELRAAIRL